MKKNLLLLYLLSSLVSNAQSFLGISIGMDAKKAYHILSEQYEVTWYEGDLRIKNCKLGDIPMEECTIRFKDQKVMRAIFSEYKSNLDSKFMRSLWVSPSDTTSLDKNMNYDDYVSIAQESHNKYKGLLKYHVDNYGSSSFVENSKPSSSCYNKMVRWSVNGTTIVAKLEQKWEYSPSVSKKTGVKKGLGQSMLKIYYIKDEDYEYYFPNKN